MKGKNPTLLTLLQKGCTVTFPSGYSVTGIPTEGYIQLRAGDTPDGLRDLSRAGVNDAFYDEKSYRTTNHIE
jgi:hypothetical protein